MKKITKDEINILYKRGPLAFGSHLKDIINEASDLNTILSICLECSKIINSIYMDKDKITFVCVNGQTPDPYSVEEAVYSILDNFDIMKNIESIAKKENIIIFSNLINMKDVFSQFIRYSHKYLNSTINVQDMTRKLNKLDMDLSRKKISNLKNEG